MTLKLYLLRHGQTIYSRSGSYCGTLDIDLTTEGLEMANAFAEAYKNLEWSAIFASPMKRTIATAKPLSDTIKMPIQLRDGLKEIAYGKWEGKTGAEVDQDFHDDYVRWLAEPGWNSPTGGEKGIEIAQRASAVLEEIKATYATGNVLIVSHKATIRIMLCWLLGIDIGRFRDRIGMPVASISIIQYGVHGPLVEVMGDRTHLPPDLRKLN